MTLKDLVRKALVEIAEGVNESHEGVKCAGGNIVGSESSEVEFDVAIAATTTQIDDDDAVLEVWRPNDHWAADSESGSATVARIKFKVAMTMPKMPSANESFENAATSTEPKFAPLRGRVIPAQYKKSDAEKSVAEK